MRRFFIDEKLIDKDRVTVKGPEAHHIRDVVRLKHGDRFIGLDGKGKIYTLRVIEAKKDVIACIERISLQGAGNNKILLACAIPKKNKMDDIVEKATELGAVDIIPMITERTIVKADSKASVNKRFRWQKIAIEASKQSGRIEFPQIHNIVGFEEALKVAASLDYDNKIIPFVGEGMNHINNVMRQGVKNTAIFIGPEGDFTQKEIAFAKSQGFKIVSLGALVLKVDTACIFALSVVSSGCFAGT